VQHLAILIALLVSFAQPSAWGLAQGRLVQVFGTFVATIAGPVLYGLWLKRRRFLNQTIAEWLAPLLCLAGFAIAVKYFAWRACVTAVLGGFGRILADDILAYLPFAISLTLIWAVRYKLQHMTFQQTRQAVFFRLRFYMLPMLPAFIFISIHDAIPFMPQVVRDAYDLYPLISLLSLSTGLIVVFYLFAPFAICLFWKTSPFSHTSLALYINHFCRNLNFRYRQVRIWHTGGTGIANAAIVGPFAWCRFVFLSDGLIAAMDHKAIEAVIAHEIGHIRHRHFPQFLIFMLGSVVFHLAVGDLIGNLMDPITASLIAFLIYWGLLFGMLSRCLEHQADIFAVGHIPTPSAFAHCMEKLCLINNIQRKRTNWRHPSMDARIRVTNEVAQEEGKGARFKTWPVKALCMTIIVVSCFQCIPMIKDEWQRPPEITFQYLGEAAHMAHAHKEALQYFRRAQAIKPNPALEQAIQELEQLLDPV